MILDKVRSRRLVYAHLAIVLAVLVLAGRLWYVQIVQGPELSQLATQNHLRVDVIEPPRGIIYDRYDQQLVENAPIWVVTASPDALSRQDAPRVLGVVAELTGADLGQLELVLQKGRASSAAPVDLLRDIPRDTALTLIEHTDELPGITVQSEAVRHYLDGPIFSQVLGYMGRIDPDTYKASQDTDQPYPLNAQVGQAGIEQGYESELRGKLGHATVAVDAAGRTVTTLATEPAIPGAGVELTLDATVQKAAYDALTSALQRAGAASGAAVAVDPRDGALVALVSVPSFDNNLFVDGISAADWQRLNADPALPLLDHAIAAQYPPGPLLDPFIAAAALQQGIVQPGQTVACPPLISAQGWNFYNSSAAANAPLNVTEGLARRCDTLFYSLVGGIAGATGPTKDGLGNQTLQSWLTRFGFASRTGVPLLGETSGFIPDPQWKQNVLNANWSPIDTYLVAAGAGPMAVTPIQVAMATAALANGGTVWQPVLLQRLIAPDGSVLRQLQPDAVRRLNLQPSTTIAIGRGLAENVATNEASSVAVPGLAIAGLSAVAMPSGDTVGQQGLNAWWAGYAPADDPQLAVVVLVAGGSDPDAGMPVAHAMFQAYFKPNLTEAQHVP